MRLAVVIVLLVAGTAYAHDLRPGILAFVEDSPGDLRMRFVPPIDARGEASEVALVLPDGCTRKGDRVRCKNGFGGTLAVGGMRGHAMKIYVSLERDGTRHDWVITSESPRLELGTAPGITDRIGIAALALLVGLLLVFGPSMRFVMSVVAFFVAEALVGFVRIDGPLAALAAASVLLVAREATHDRVTAMRRWPWLAGALFGAVHGLAFSPRPVYLFAQLAVIGVVAALVALSDRSIGEGRIIRLRAHRAACYALGALAAYRLIVHLASG
ncbi:MAG: hypothetical protein M4D80_21710 [Myxococcota bacterium]|nr:hypothetical protein [Deltaproteobacteria bacterium]MDQ3337786.1 hypothetical protein [Myxococcota bacterium]